MKKIKTIISILLLIVASCIILNAQQTPQKYVSETEYLLYLPDSYKADTAKYPLLMFLHGAGETGTDIEKLKVHGPPKLIEQGKNFPFIVVSPQAKRYGWKPLILYDLLQDVISQYRVDVDRIYLTGLSMGGFGTWDMAMEYPDLFAAIIPICGGGDTSKVWQLDIMPVWCFHGAKDNIVSLSSSEKTVDALKKYNADVKFTIYPDAYHDSWSATYDNDSIYTWLLQHKRFSYQQVEIDEALLKKYAGKYMIPDNRVFELEINETVIKATIDGRHIFDMKAAADNLFFINKDVREHIIFEKDEQGNILGFNIINKRNKTFFRRIN